MDATAIYLILNYKGLIQFVSHVTFLPSSMATAIILCLTFNREILQRSLCELPENVIICQISAMCSLFKKVIYDKVYRNNTVSCICVWVCVGVSGGIVLLQTIHFYATSLRSSTSYHPPSEVTHYKYCGRCTSDWISMIHVHVRTSFSWQACLSSLVSAEQ